MSRELAKRLRFANQFVVARSLIVSQGTNGRHQVTGDVFFGDVGGSASAKHGVLKLLFNVRGQRNNTNIDMGTDNLTRSINAIKVGHANVHEYNVGFQCLCQRDSFSAVVSFADTRRPGSSSTQSRTT